MDQGNAPTDNDNYRIGNPPATDSPDPCTDCNGIDWDPATRILRLRNNSTLTLGGGVYSFCGIEIENTAQLKIPVRPLGTGIRIFIDSPEHCGGAGTGSVTVRNTGTILNLNTDPTTFQLNVLGSPTIATQVAFDGVDFAQRPRDGRVRALLDDPREGDRAPLRGARRRSTSTFRTARRSPITSGSATSPRAARCACSSRSTTSSARRAAVGAAPDSGC